MKTLRIGSLFAGIGGLDQGVEVGLAASGFRSRVTFQAECNPYSLAILAKHWPDARRYTDVRDVHEGSDVLIGGFPCTDLSVIGLRGGLAAERSGLWYEFARIIRETEPAGIVIENVSGLLCPIRGAGPAPIFVLLEFFAEQGYTVAYAKVPAFAVGARHLRDRVFLVAAREVVPPRGVGSTGPASLLPHDWSARGLSPEIARSTDVPYHLERVEALGNSVVPAAGYVAGRMLGVMMGGHAADTSLIRARTAAWTGEFYAAWTQNALEDAHRRKVVATTGRAPAQAVLIDGVVREAFKLPFDFGPETCDLPTCIARDWRSGKVSAATRAKNARPLNEMAAPGGFLNPEWVEATMGFERGHTELPPGVRLKPRKRGGKPCE